MVFMFVFFILKFLVIVRKRCLEISFLDIVYRLFFVSLEFVKKLKKKGVIVYFEKFYKYDIIKLFYEE